MINLGKKNLLGVNINIVDYEYSVSEVISAAEERRKLSVTALAVHGVMTGAMNLIQRYQLNRLDLLTPDGQPVRWALNLLYNVGLSERVYGPALMLMICEKAQEIELPIFLFGSSPNVLRRLTENLKEKYPKLIVAGFEPSRYRQVSVEEQDETIRNIQSSGAVITFVGLGCPRQEVWLFENSHHLSMPLIAVGAAFDFHAGNISQAPDMMQRYGFEWLYRLIREPARLWRRYLILNPIFLLFIFLQKTGIKKFKPDHAESPKEDLRFG